MKPEKRYTELDDCNAVACLLVIFIHVVSLGITSLARDSAALALIYLPWKLAAFVVPCFLFMGAVKMGLLFRTEEKAGKRTPYLPYLWRRILKIYVPYVIWVGIYYLYFLRIGWVERGFSVFLGYVWRGDLSSPFYYVVTVMQFYLLMPVWRMLVRHIPFFVGVPVSALISLFMLYAGNLCAQIGIPFAYFDRVFPTYLFFFVTGLYVGMHYETMRRALRQNLCAVCAPLAAVVLYVVLMWRQYAENLWLIDGNVIKPFCDFLTVLALLAVFIVFRDRYSERAAAGRPPKPLSAALDTVLSFVYRSSFCVYLSHCLFLEEGTSKLKAFGVTDIGALLVGRALICYTLPFLLAAALRWISRMAKRFSAKYKKGKTIHEIP